MKLIPAKFGQTSSAAPLITSLVTVALATKPNITAAAVKKLLIDSSVQHGDIKRLNVKRYYKALKAH